MDYAADIGRRIRRQPRARLVFWATLAFIIFVAYPRLRDGMHRGGHNAILLTPPDKKVIPQCSQVSSKEIEKLQAARHMTIHTYRSGTHLADSQEVNEAVALCMIAAIPQSMPEMGVFKDVPVLGQGPDNIHLYINSSSILIPLPPMRPLPSQPSAQMQLAPEAVLYYAEVKLKDPGVYEISAEREFANWRWAKQWRCDLHNNSVDFITGHQALLSPGAAKLEQMQKLQEVNLIVNDGSLFEPRPIERTNIHPPAISVNYNTHPDLPNSGKKRCTALPNFSEKQGRWYNATDFPNMPEGLADEWGFIYVPDDCELDYFTDLDTANCLENKTIHVFGDSNARRISRAIVSGGRWCHDPKEKCQSEDWGQDVLKVVWNDLFNTLMEETESPEHNGQFELNDGQPFSFGRRSKLSFNFLQSIAYHSGDWLKAFYDENDFWVSHPDPVIPVVFDPAQIHAGAKARHKPDQPKPDLVVIAIGAWDEAFDEKFDDFEQTAPYFRDAIMKAYPDVRTKLALRLSQGHCCRRNWTQDIRRFSGLRIEQMGNIFRAAFDVENGTAMKGRMLTVDASGMAGRPEVVNDYGGVGSNHQRAAHSRLEAQILFNKICVRDHSGRAIWKEDNNTTQITQTLQRI